MIDIFQYYEAKSFWIYIKEITKISTLIRRRNTMKKKFGSYLSDSLFVHAKFMLNLWNVFQYSLLRDRTLAVVHI